MRLDVKAKLAVDIETTAWAFLENPNKTLDQAIEGMREMSLRDTGIEPQILIKDPDGTNPENPRPGTPAVKLLHTSSAAWVCDHCNFFLSTELHTVESHERICDANPNIING